ncbi:hypothetical protein L8O38_22065, partial [Enterobacter bugandensis]|nr:hypothetical protein [Enterobacter bugandensis]
MAVNAEVPIIEFNGGATTYTFPFRVIDVSDLKVYVNGSEVTTGFTITLNGDKGGDVVFAAATPAGKNVVMLRRDTPFKRDTDYQNNGSLLADTIDDDFDRLWLCLQEEKAASDITLNKPIGGDAWQAEKFRIENLADGINPQDAATYKQLTDTTASATGQANAAAASAAAAESSHQQAHTDAVDSGNSAAASAASAAKALQSEQNAFTHATNAGDSATAAAGSAAAAAASAAAAKTSEQNAANSNVYASQNADRAKTEADRAQ